MVAITKLVMNIADSRVNTMAGLYDLMDGHSSTTHAPRVSKRTNKCPRKHKEAQTQLSEMDWLGVERLSVHCESVLDIWSYGCKEKKAQIQVNVNMLEKA